MRKTALVVLLLAAVLCLLASGSERDGVRICFTLAPPDEFSGTQLWICNRDGSAPLLLHEGLEMGPVVVDSGSQRVYFLESCHLKGVNVDGSNLTDFGCGGEWFVLDLSIRELPFDVKSDYLCHVSHLPYRNAVRSVRVDGADEQEFNVWVIPGVDPDSRVADLALYLGQAAPVESTSWGRIKSKYQR